MTIEEAFFKVYKQGQADAPPPPTIPPTLPSKTRRIAVINQKGGCGKTTTAVNLSACLAELGCRVLLVDLDPQGHATLALGIRGDELPVTIYHSLKPGGAPLAEVIQPTYHANLKLVPANTLLASTHVELVEQPARERILSERLESVAHWFHYIILDCAPSLNLLTVNALTACSDVLIPIQTHYLSLDGMRELFKTIEVVQSRFNPQLKILGILPTMFDRRTRMNRAMLETINDYFKDKVLKSVIRLSSPLTECPMMGQPVIRYAPQARGADDYRRLAEELLQQHG